MTKKIFTKIYGVALVLVLCLSMGVGVGAVSVGGNSDVSTGLTGSGSNSDVSTGLSSGGRNSDASFSNSGNVGGNSNVSSGGSSLGKPKLSIPGITTWFVGLLNYIVILIITASLVCFLYGVFRLSFVDGTNPESMAKSRKFMLWGIVSLFVMVSVWGLVNILKSSIFGNGGLILPQLK